MTTQEELSVLQVAALQHGVFTRSQWAAHGLPARTLARRVVEGRFTALGEGAFLVSGVPRTTRTELAAATLVVPHSVVSHEAAAELHDLPLVPRGTGVVMTPHRNANSSKLARVRRTTHLPDADRTVVDCLPATTLARTVLDLSRVVGSRRLTAVIDHVLSRQRLTAPELFAAFDSYARRGRPRVALLRRVLATFAVADGIPESLLERDLLELLDRAGLPAPVVQFPLPWRDEIVGIADLAWPTHRLIVEADGRTWHTRTDAFERDRQRDNVAQTHGWKVLRFSYAMVRHRPSEVVAMVRACL